MDFALIGFSFDLGFAGDLGLEWDMDLDLGDPGAKAVMACDSRFLSCLFFMAPRMPLGLISSTPLSSSASLEFDSLTDPDSCKSDGRDRFRELELPARVW
jgi:hypothetical protein